MKGDRESLGCRSQHFETIYSVTCFVSAQNFAACILRAKRKMHNFTHNPVHYTREEESFKLVLRGTRNLRHGKLDRCKHFCMLLQFTIQTNKTRRIMQPDAQKLQCSANWFSQHKLGFPFMVFHCYLF